MPFEDEIGRRIEQAVAAQLDAVAIRFADAVAEVRRREPSLTEVDVDRIVAKSVGRIFGVDLEDEPRKLREAVDFAVSVRAGAGRTAWAVFLGFIGAVVAYVASKLGLTK